MTQLKIQTVVGSLALALCGAASAGDTAPVKLDVALGQPVLRAGATQRTFLRVGLEGADLERRGARAPVNLSIVLDRSGSMSGEKLEQAKIAAIQALERLQRDDIVSVVAYDDVVRVLVPATKLDDRGEIYRRIRDLGPGGSTALFAGVSKGAAELRKFLSRERVNRVILLSDGLANVGPSSPAALGQLGASLAREGITVSTIGLGLGYNEDLMVTLARRADGNHAFVEHPRQLAQIFDYEFGDVLSVVAQDLTVIIRCADGVRPLRVLGRDAEIVGGTVKTRLNQVYGKQEKYVLLEVEVPAGGAGQSQELASVDVAFHDLVVGQSQSLRATQRVAFSASDDEVERRTDQRVMVAAVEQIATENSRAAVSLRDSGKLDQAQRVLQDNAAYLRQNAARYKSERLEQLGASNEDDGDNVKDEQDWGRRRKAMRKQQYEFEAQQGW